MKMDYANNNCEKRARELLAPLAGVCPDSVWDGICIDLEAKRAETNSKWLNKLSSAPKIPLIAAGIIIVITLSAWMIITHKGQSNIVASNTQVKPVVTENPKPIVSNNVPVIPAPVMKKDSLPQIMTPVTVLVPGQTPVIAKNDKSKKLITAPDNSTAAKQTETGKVDNSPMVIHTNNEGDPSVTTTDMPGGKGVAIDLNRKDSASTFHTVSNHSSAELGMPSDSAQ